MSQLVNPVKVRLQAGEPALGMSVRLSRSGEIARIAKATGHDFLFIDVQHAIFNVETIARICDVALAVGIAPLVRVRGITDPDVSMLLDNGATGIVFPDINTAAQARRAVELCKFPPVGRRSVGANFPQFDLRAVPLTEAVPQLNASTLVVCMIETVEGVGNVEEIAKVDGLDVIHVGSNDLLVNMGKPGKFDDPELAAAQDRVIKAARANGKYAGMGGNRDVGKQADAIRRGAQFITTQSDIGFISAAAGQWTQGIRAALGRKG
jgi:staphyloferrin B biosynthesis citrate synthase